MSRDQLVSNAYDSIRAKLFDDLVREGYLTINDGPMFDANYLAGPGLQHAIESTIDRVIHAHESKGK